MTHQISGIQDESILMSHTQTKDKFGRRAHQKITKYDKNLINIITDLKWEKSIVIFLTVPP
jgi:hypothetical protein